MIRQGSVWYDVVQRPVFRALHYCYKKVFSGS